MTRLRKPPEISLNSRIDGPEIDLDREEVYLKSGQRLTEALRREIVDEVLGKRRRLSPRGLRVRSPGRARHDAS